MALSILTQRSWAWGWYGLGPWKAFRWWSTELARILYFQRISPDWLQEGHSVVARMEVDYLRPIYLEDEVRVGAKVVGIGRSSLKMEHLILANGEPAARGLSVLVWLDEGRPAPLPEAVRRRIEEVEGRSF